jgi:hypothetical protein
MAATADETRSPLLEALVAYALAPAALLDREAAE